MRDHERKGSMRRGRETSHVVLPGRNVLSHSTPWWKHPAVGYIAACLLVAAGIGITLFEKSQLTHSYFSASFLLLTTLLVSHLWGVGPGLLASVLSCVALGLFLSLPDNESGPVPLSLELLFRLLPFTLASFIIAIITGQREAARKLLQKRAGELTSMNQELEQANHLKDVFLTRAAHELRTPLTTILGEAQLALRRLNKAESAEIDYQKSFEKVEARAKRLQTFIEDLLELSRLRAYEAPLRLTPCDFGKICREVVEDQQALSGRQIVVQFSSQPLILQADGARLSQVIVHLIENALQYSYEGTLIRVGITVDDRGILLQVSNEGIGLSLEQQEQVFEPFYRAPFAQEVFPKGWGLGLTVSKEIVERHDGQIWIQATEGKDIAFFVRIPFRTEKAKNGFT